MDDKDDIEDVVSRVSRRMNGDLLSDIWLDEEDGEARDYERLAFEYWKRKPTECPDKWAAAERFVKEWYNPPHGE